MVEIDDIDPSPVVNHVSRIRTAVKNMKTMKSAVAGLNGFFDAICVLGRAFAKSTERPVDARVEMVRIEAVKTLKLGQREAPVAEPLQYPLEHSLPLHVREEECFCPG